MTLDTVLLLVLTVYLILVAYGIVGISRSGRRARRVAAVLLVVLPPVLITGLLVATGEGAVVQAWGRLFVAMPVVGAVVAVAAGRVAKAVAS